MEHTREQRTIAAGGNPRWQETFAHPVHGELTFAASLPLARDSLRHSIALDNELAALESDPSNQTLLIAAALAGLRQDASKPAGHGVLVELPAIDQTEVHDEEAGHSRIQRVYYDAGSEADLSFLSDVWIAFSTWRGEQLSDATVRAVGESSAEETTAASSASSTP